MTTDLSRIPEVYRERVQRLVTAAREATIARCSADDVERAVQEAERAALAPFLAIAMQADDAADEASEDFEDADGARAKVWAEELAKLDAPAEPPPGYWSTGIAVERKADPASDDDTVPPDLAPDAEQAVRAAQRGHLDATRPGIFEGDAWRVPAVAGPIELTITCPDALRRTLDAVVRYLAGHVAFVPSDLALRVITGLAATLPRGHGAAVDVPATLTAIEALTRAMPWEPPLGNLTLSLHYAETAAVQAVAALPDAKSGAMFVGPDSALLHARAVIGHLEVTAQASVPTLPGLPSIAGAAGLDMAARAGGDR